MTPSPQDVTQVLKAWGQGDEAAFERLMPLVYEELRRVARRYMGRERADHTLQTTALVNEAYLRLIDASRGRVAKPRPLLRHLGAIDAANPG